LSTETVRPELLAAIEAAQDKKAGAITLLDLTGLGAFTDYFLLLTGYSTPQVEAIIDAVEGALKARGLRPQHREGRSGAEWLLLEIVRIEPFVQAFVKRLLRPQINPVAAGTIAHQIFRIRDIEGRARGVDDDRIKLPSLYDLSRGAGERLAERQLIIGSGRDAVPDIQIANAVIAA